MVLRVWWHQIAAAGLSACNAVHILANQQGIGIAPIKNGHDFQIDQEKSWTSTDPKLTIDFKPNDAAWFGTPV